MQQQRRKDIRVKRISKGRPTLPLLREDISSQQPLSSSSHLFTSQEIFSVASTCIDDSIANTQDYVP